jgi:hypothetical protein
METSPLEPELARLIVTAYEGERDELGRFDGQGAATFESGATYAGTFAQGMMDGTGTYAWPDGTTYAGSFVRNHLDGAGDYTWADGSKYTGAVAAGLRHGAGAMTGPGGVPKYVGAWVSGQRCGRGSISFDAAGKSAYDGGWVADKREGEGTMTYASGNVYQGGWRAGRKCGAGAMRWADRAERYVGAWADDAQHGHGEHVWLDADAARSPGAPAPAWAGTQRQMCNRYVGQWRGGARHGVGTFLYANGATYVGEWRANLKHGHGVFTCVLRRGPSRLRMVPAGSHEPPSSRGRARWRHAGSRRSHPDPAHGDGVFTQGVVALWRSVITP